MKRVFLSFFLVSAFLSTPVSAQESIGTLPEIVVTATRVAEPKEEVTQDITVITREDIEKRGVEFVTDILREFTDLDIVQNGGFGKNATLYLRGGSPNQVVVMIDGVKVKSPTTGSLDLSGILVDDIERIEVIKGPQSTLYGSEAMAGVVNIITKRGSGRTKLALSAEGGSFTTFKTTASLSGGEDIWDYRITASFFDTEGISAARTGDEDDGYTNRALSAKIGVTPSEKLNVELNLRYLEDISELDGYEYGVGMVDDLNFIQKGEHYLLSAKGSLFLFDNYEQVLTLSTVGDDLRFEDPDTLFNNADIDTTMKTVDWQHNLYLDKATLTAGVEYRKESGENRDNFDEEIENKALYLNGKTGIFNDSLVLNAGLRYDDHETSGSRITYRTGALYNLKAYGLRVRVAYATGFRAPSLNELYYPFFGNPGLKPEKSRGYDIGVEKDFFRKKLSLNATYFVQKYRDLIQYDFVTFTAQNIGRAEVKGLTVGLTARPTGYVTFRASYTNMDSVDKETGRPLTRRPDNKFSSTIEYNAGGLTLLGEYLYVSDRFDSAVDRTLSSYSLVNLRGSYAVNERFTIFARIDNLFDEDYEEAGGYGTPGMSVFGGIKVKL